MGQRTAAKLKEAWDARGRLEISEFRLQISLPQIAGSEAEGKELGAAGGVTVYQRSEANLMGNTGARKPFGNDANDNTQHCCTTIKKFDSFELFQQNKFFGPMLKPLSASRSVRHWFWLEDGGVRNSTMPIATAIWIWVSDRWGD